MLVLLAVWIRSCGVLMDPKSWGPAVVRRSTDTEQVRMNTVAHRRVKPLDSRATIIRSNRVDIAPSASGR
ncbi:hypothetical protein BKA93DRAFT_606530 [Sparassis latifolia]